MCVNDTDYLFLVAQGPFRIGNSKGEARERSRRKNNSKRVARNMNVGTKGKYPKQGLTSDKDLIIQLPEERESPYHSSDSPNLQPLRAIQTKKIRC